MTKTKELIPTKEEVKQSEQKQPEVKQEVLSGKFIDNNLVQALVVYLDTRPHGEVRNLIDSLSRLMTVNVPIAPK